MVDAPVADPPVPAAAPAAADPAPAPKPADTPVPDPKPSDTPAPKPNDPPAPKPDDKPVEAPKDTPPAAPAKPADAPPVVTYDLKLPENSGIDPTAVERTVAFAKARGLPQDAAQATLELVATEVAKHREADETAFKAQVETWKQTAANDGTLGATPEERRAAVAKGRLVLDKFEQANPDRGKAMKTFLDESGFREHPAVVGFFAWLGKAAGEGPLIIPTPDANARPKSAAEIMYGPDGGRGAHEAREAERRARHGG